MAASTKADVLDATNEISATFTAVPNTSNMLLFFNNDPLTITGTPILTLTLFNGATTLGSIVASPFEYAGTPYFQNLFQSPTSTFTNTLGTPAETVNFTSINSGTIDGSMIWTVSGGSLSGFSISDFFLEDANAVTGGYEPLSDVTSTIKLESVPSPTPEPSSLSLMMLGVGVVGLAGLALKKSLCICN
jgi:hypothetical protein